MFLESSGRTACNGDRILEVSKTTKLEDLLLVEAQSEVLHCLGVVLVLEADLAQSEESLEESLLYHNFGIWRNEYSSLCQ